MDVESPVKSRAPEFVERIKSLHSDVLLVAAYGQILSMALLESAKQGGINLHGSILPKYRGAAPIQRCIQNGDAETGVTLMQMAAGMDTGDIIAIERTPIGPEETAGEVSGRLARIAGEMAREWMPLIAAGQYARTPQDDALATMAPKVEKHEAEMLFENAVGQEYDRYRAFTPFPGAFLKTSRGHVRIGRAALRLGQNPGPGKVAGIRRELVVGFQGGSIALIEVQPEGKKRMSGADWAKGARIAEGDCLLP